jgi:hypothetical protein
MYEHPARIACLVATVYASSNRSRIRSLTNT